MRLIRLFHVLLGLSLVAALLGACSGQDNKSYDETFDQTGNWSSGIDTFTEGEIIDGVYDLLIKGDDVSRWASAGKDFSDGIYSVEATQVEGPLDNGYGMLLRADTDSGNFYLFKISGDGYVWIGRYRDEMEEQPIIGDHWFESSAIKQGLNQTNKLRVDTESGNLIFFINGQEVGRVTDKTFQSGDIGLFAQSLGQGGVRIQFDNFSVTPPAR